MPDMLKADVVIVTPVPDLVIATLPVQTPFAKAVVLVGLIVPVVSVRAFVPV